MFTVLVVNEPAMNDNQLNCRPYGKRSGKTGVKIRRNRKQWKKLMRVSHINQER
jgi:hypothetical protein